MEIVDQLYRDLKAKEKAKIEAKIAEEEELERKQQEEEDMSEDEILELIRQIMVMQNLSRAERDRRIQELLAGSGERRSELEATVNIEQLRRESEEKRGQQEEGQAQEPQRQFSYGGAGGGAGNPYNRGKEEEEDHGPYAMRDGHDEAVHRLHDGFHDTVSRGRDGFKEITDKKRSPYTEAEVKKEAEPNSSYEH